MDGTWTKDEITACDRYEKNIVSGKGITQVDARTYWTIVQRHLSPDWRTKGSVSEGYFKWLAEEMTRTRRHHMINWGIAPWWIAA